MDVNLSEDQQMLQDMTRRFLEDRSPVSALRKLVDRDESLDREVWREGADLGWVALFVPEEFGGIAEESQGVADASVIAEELGRVVFGGPFLSSCVVAFAIAQSGSDAQKAACLPGLAAGETLAAWCFAARGPQGGAQPGGVRAKQAGEGWVLDGTAALVEDAQVADLLLVTALAGDRLAQFVLPTVSTGVSVRPLDAMDLGRRIAEVDFSGVSLGADALLGALEMADEAFERQLQVALALQCAETVGVTDRAFEFTLEWCKDRYAFGRPIGSFQALKHRLARHAANLEAAKAAAAHAARSVQTQAPDACVAVSVAKSHCGRQATEIIRDCLQLHGGIGLTWEHDIHLYLRRAVSNEALWGPPSAHHDRLCRFAGI